MPHLTARTTTSSDARALRRDLTLRLFALDDLDAVGADLPPLRRGDPVARWWPALDAVRHLGYRVLALSWWSDEKTHAAAALTTAGAEEIESELAIVDTLLGKSERGEHDVGSRGLAGHERD